MRLFRRQKPAPVINVTVNGTADPAAVAQQIERVLRDYGPGRR